MTSTPPGEPGAPEPREGPGEAGPVPDAPSTPPELPAAPPLEAGQAASSERPALARPIWGVVVGVVLYLAAYGLVLGQGIDTADYWAINYAVSGFLLTVALLVAGVILTVIRRTRGFGAGMLISVAIGVLGGGGVCVALLAT